MNPNNLKAGILGVPDGRNIKQKILPHLTRPDAKEKGEPLPSRKAVYVQHSRRALGPTTGFRLPSKMEDVQASPGGGTLKNAVSYHMDTFDDPGTLFWTEGMWR